MDDRSSANLSSMKAFPKLGPGKSATMLEVKPIPTTENKNLSPVKDTVKDEAATINSGDAKIDASQLKDIYDTL